MRKKLLSIVALLLMTVTCAVAQNTHTVTLKEGTEDATNWTITPAEATTTGVAAGTEVKATYNGTKKVKSVKAVKKADPLAVPLTMEALTAGNIEVGILNPYTMEPVELSTGMKYSVNGGEKHLITTTTTIEDLVAGDKVQFYGNGTSTQVYGGNPLVMLQGTAQTKVYGNIMSLIDETDYATLTTLPNQPSVFMALFMGNTTLTDASGLLLPATTLANRCYGYMFYGCTSLTTAPTLPATTLAGNCYGAMFYGCTSLTTAPALPATELAGECYSSMFERCTSLTTAPTLPATTLAEGCYNNMFYKCTSLTAAPALPVTTLAESCYSYMFGSCTSLTTAPALPATTLVENCYAGMFDGCTSLNSVTCLATDISASDCLDNWLNSVAATGTFYANPSTGWSNGATGIPTGWTRKDANILLPLTMEALTAGNIEVNMTGTLTTGMKYSVNNGEKTPITTATTIPVNAGDKVQFYGNGTSTQVYGNDPVVMLQGTAQTKVYGNIMSLIDETGYATLTTLPNQDYVFYGLFDGNTNLTDASGLLLPATTLANGCYGSMFSGCTSLTTAPALPAATLAEGCYSSMFYGCTSLTTAPTLPAATLAEGCYSSMFYGCTSLTAAPTLPATTLANSCYENMFNGCTSLTTAPELPATTLAGNCYDNMFSECTSLTTAPELPATTLASYCYFGMFSGCTSLVTAPELPATSLTDWCYASMFWSCTSLVTAPTLPATTLADACYGNMFSDCTSLTTAPALPATTLAEYCYKYMFSGCTSLSSITCLATEVINESTSDWVNGVASTGTFTKASGANWSTGNSGIPNGWTEIEQ